MKNELNAAIDLLEGGGNPKVTYLYSKVIWTKVVGHAFHLLLLSGSLTLYPWWSVKSVSQSVSE